jgi:tetratricopeptide (TPR) repeat protein
LDSFDIEVALKWCYKGLNRYPDNNDILEAAGNVMLEMGHIEDAIKCFQRAIDFHPNDGYIKYLQLGQINSGNEAVDFITKGIQIMLNSHADKHQISVAYCSLAEIFLTDLCYEEEADSKCYGYCNKALCYDPFNVECYHLLASYNLSKCDIEQAKEHLLKGVKLWLPKLANKKVVLPSYFSRVNLSKLLIEVEEYDVALKVLEGLLVEDDEVLSVWYLIGWLEYLRGNLDESLEHLQRVVNLYEKLNCDEEEMLAHSREILDEIASKNNEKSK